MSTLNEIKERLQVRESNTQELLRNIKTNIEELKKLSNKINDCWAYEDGVYRFYHQSFKAYDMQSYTIDCVELLKKLAPKNIIFNSFFEQIFSEGTNIKFKSSHNKQWLKHTRPILEAFFHAKYFIEMAVKSGNVISELPTCLPSCWAGLLYFYNLR
jgi:hypothetical protein